jgi:hypothetical protein
MRSELEALQHWYESQCDGDWEHEFGVKIGTLDNPGWMVDIDLEGTSLEDRAFPPINDVEPERDWISCDVRENTFRGRGGPLMLGRILRVFLDWAHEEQGQSTSATV